ncbi:MAG: PDZ domain-containing protein [Terriglobales bacterium]
MVRRVVFTAVVVLLSAYLAAGGPQSQSAGSVAPAQPANPPTAGPPIGSIGMQFQTGNQPPERVTKIVVDGVIEGGPAAQAGLQAGDIITSADGRAAANAAEFVSAIQAHAIGSTVTIGYERNGQQLDASVTVVDRKQLWTAWFARSSQAEQSAGEREENGAQLTLRRSLSAVIVGLQSNPEAIVIDPIHCNFNFDSFEFSAKFSKHGDFQQYKLDLKTLPRVFPKRGFGGMYRVKDEAGNDLPKPLDHLWWHPRDQHAQANAESMANALNHLRYLAGDRNIMALRNFEDAAGIWSTLSPKPPVPEAVREERLLAENAFKEGKTEEALYHYERGVEFDPLWPEGRFNAAVIAAELTFYAEAVEYMRAYLELAPDAPDAQSARDQMVIWNDKLRQLRSK